MYYYCESAFYVLYSGFFGWDKMRHCTVITFIVSHGICMNHNIRAACFSIQKYMYKHIRHIHSRLNLSSQLKTPHTQYPRSQRNHQ